MKNLRTKLSYTLYILLAAFLFCGCGNGENTFVGENVYRIIKIDGCEYIAKYNGYQRGYMFAHKGNCKFCVERSKK